MTEVQFGVSEFIAIANQSLEYAFPSVEVIGEVASFKVNQSKFVFFDLKDAESSVGCFMTVWQLRTPLEDGMKVIVKATPKLTKWGKFSLTVQSVRLVGEGAIKKSFELLRQKLESEGLFDAERKRALPAIPKNIAVITSTQAAGYADFIKIINERWGGLDIRVAHTQVQGDVAADQMIRALEYFQQLPELPEVVVLIRGGGSLDDLAAYNDEHLVRAVAASRIPTLVGVGHETDTSLVDLAADVRAATPSNAAQLLVPDKRELIAEVRHGVSLMAMHFAGNIERQKQATHDLMLAALNRIGRTVEAIDSNVIAARRALTAYDPRQILRRGYALVRGEIAVGSTIAIEMTKYDIGAEVRDVKTK